MADSGLTEIAFDAQFHDNVRCHFDGLTQQLLSLTAGIVPVIQGRYDCQDMDRAKIEGGIFSVNLVSFTRLPLR